VPAVIARLEGVLLEKTPTRVILGVDGVGYEALIPLSTFTRLPDEGKTVALRIHTHVREDALQLYGFYTRGERAAFELLLHASRIGPKLAQTILSGIEADALVNAIREGDAAALRSVPGVGPKTAERIVVELRDRAEDLAGISTGFPRASLPGPRSSARGEAHHQLVSALVNLQTPKARAERVGAEVIGELGESAAIEDLVRAALRRLAK
jgi:Holliday junction DNA helicase RuvA